jgi:hypothetical protein
MGEKLPGRGVMGWLGRQVGYVAGAVSRDPVREAEKVVYREERVEERAHPAEPGVVLRRTVVDEVVEK